MYTKDINFNQVEELSLLIWAARGSKLPKVLSRWSGCEPEVYNENCLVRMLQHAMWDIIHVYPNCAPQSIWEYFYYKRIGQSELEALYAGMFNIMPDVFSGEDKERIKALRKEYINVEDVK